MVDRIAAAAPANKQAIYLYFGSKEQLFDEVMDRETEDFGRAVPFFADDLPGYAASMFDYLASNPELRRLLLWKELELTRATPDEAASYRTKCDAIADEIRIGAITSTLSPVDILAIVVAIGQNWMRAGAALRSLASSDAWSGPRLAEQRSAIQAAVIAVLRETAASGNS